MKKSKNVLGQHWLTDQTVLTNIRKEAKLSKQDDVLEIGPGTGALTKLLAAYAKKVFAVELDEDLAKDLPRNANDSNLEVIQADILKFDLTQLPPDYKVVANIPYYLTSNLIRKLSESANPPDMMVLLVQKEVAERIAAKPGQMSMLSVSTQLYYMPKLGIIVPAKLFDPVPKVDSQVIVLTKLTNPLFNNLDTEKYFRVVKAGFSSRRKKLKSSISAGMGISKADAEDALKQADIDPNLRAQNLSLEQWYEVSKYL